MTLHNIWGHTLFHREAPEPSGAAGAAPVPGAGEAVPGDPQQPPSGATQPVAEEPPPGPIPYARFKEVNDARRQLEEQVQPFLELEQSGYEAADLQRLAAWEQEYLQDPVGTWLRQVEQIDGFPDEVKAAIEAHVSQGTQGTPPADAAPSSRGSDQPTPGDEPPDWARPLIEDHQTRQQREQEEAIKGFYDGLVDAWKRLDTEQGIETPAEAIHAHLAAASPSAASAEELLRTGRETYLSVRESILGSTVRVPGRDGQVPRAVPGSGAAAGSAQPVRPRTLQEARKAALADPSITGAS